MAQPHGITNEREAGRQPTRTASSVRRARFGVAITFFLTGAIFATWAARVPAIRTDLRLDDGALAIASMGLNAGAIVGLQLGGIVVSRTGSRPALRWSVPGFAVALVTIALAPSLVWLTLALFISAAVNSVVDVGMNAHGVRIEQLQGKPILSGLHAMHPLGGMAAGGLAALAAWQGLGTRWHFGLIAAVAAVVAVVATGWLLPATAEREADQASGTESDATVTGWFRGWSRSVLALGGLAFCVTLAEGGMLDWGAVFLRDGRGASASLAATGVAVFLTGIMLGRFAGDRLIERFGHSRMFRAGGAVTTAGFAITLAIDRPLAGVVGIGLIGAGISYLLPMLFSVAGNSNDEATPAALVARVSTLGYLGSFVGPGLIGSIAGAVGLVNALAIPAALVVFAALATHRIKLDRPS